MYNIEMIKDNIYNYEPVNEEKDESIEGIEWYEKWRRDNL